MLHSTYVDGMSLIAAAALSLSLDHAEMINDITLYNCSSTKAERALTSLLGRML
jgi:hypothetical protein